MSLLDLGYIYSLVIYTRSISNSVSIMYLFRISVYAMYLFRILALSCICFVFCLYHVFVSYSVSIMYLFRILSLLCICFVFCLYHVFHSVLALKSAYHDIKFVSFLSKSVYINYTE